MASYNCMAFIAILLVLLSIAKGDDSIPPILSPYVDSICNEVQCGRGSCTVALGEPFNFKCECDSGWKRTRLDSDSEKDLEFLPCIFPDCSLDYSCMPAPPPAPPVPHNLSIFDPCYYMYCGGGTCIKNLTYTRTCQCNSGYYNLLNISAFPCYNDCALGSDCGKLGINKVSNSTSSPPSNDSNQATSFLAGKFHWIAISLVFMTMVLWK